MANEATVAWNVFGVVNTPALVNNLKLVVRNNATNGKKARNDRVILTVTRRDQ